MRSMRNVLTAVLLVLASLPASAGMQPERQTWAFMQTVGGISIGDPYQNDDRWFLPVLCDISGLKTITIKPVFLNSALAAAETVVTVEGNAISVTVTTSLRSHNPRSSCRPGELGRLPRGNYTVSYRDPDGTEHALGTISIKQ